MFTRTMHGGRESLIVGVFAMLVAVTIGTRIGAIGVKSGGPSTIFGNPFGNHDGQCAT